MKSILFLLFIPLFIVQAQEVDWNKVYKTDPDVILHRDYKPTKVLLLGTFHFNYPGLDSHNTSEENKMDILKKDKQEELRQLLDVIYKFKPTKIYIESRNQSYHDSLYNSYVEGKFELGRNEIFQIAYRLGKELNHKKMYAVDAGNLNNDFHTLLTEDEQKEFLSKLFAGDDSLVNPQKDEYWNKSYYEMYEAADAQESEFTLLERFLFMAQPKVLQRMHGHYLSAGFNTQNNAGADRLVMWWYSRNLRIFNNILKTKPTQEDRILVLFGNGHMSILNECFRAAPQFEIVTLESLVKD